MLYGNKTIDVLKVGQHYAAESAFVVRQKWDDKRTTLQVRRVIHADRQEELQIEIEIEKTGGKRTTSMHSSFCVPADIADLLAEACKVIRADRRKD